jgi:hypothetical protein
MKRTLEIRLQRLEAEARERAEWNRPRYEERTWADLSPAEQEEQRRLWEESSVDEKATRIVNHIRWLQLKALHGVITPADVEGAKRLLSLLTTAKERLRKAERKQP